MKILMSAILSLSSIGFLHAAEKCPDFSGEWKGECTDTEGVLKTEFKFIQTKCDLLEIVGEETKIKLDDKWYEIEEGTSVKGSLKKTEGSDRLNELEIAFKMELDPLFLKINYNFIEDKNKEQSGTGKAGKLGSCTYKKVAKK